MVVTMPTCPSARCARRAPTPTQAKADLLVRGARSDAGEAHGQERRDLRKPKRGAHEAAPHELLQRRIVRAIDEVVRGPPGLRRPGMAEGALRHRVEGDQLGLGPIPDDAPDQGRGARDHLAAAELLCPAARHSLPYVQPEPGAGCRAGRSRDRSGAETLAASRAPQAAIPECSGARAHLRGAPPPTRPPRDPSKRADGRARRSRRRRRRAEVRAGAPERATAPAPRAEGPTARRAAPE